MLIDVLKQETLKVSVAVLSPGMVGDAPCRVDAVTIVSQSSINCCRRFAVSDLFTRVSGMHFLNRWRGPMPSIGITEALLYHCCDDSLRQRLCLFGCQFSFPAQAVRGFKRDSEQALVTGIATGLRFESLAPKLDSVSPSWLSTSYAVHNKQDLM